MENAQLYFSVTHLNFLFHANDSQKARNIQFTVTEEKEHPQNFPMSEAKTSAFLAFLLEKLWINEHANCFSSIRK